MVAVGTSEAYGGVQCPESLGQLVSSCGPLNFASMLDGRKQLYLGCKVGASSHLPASLPVQMDS